MKNVITRITYHFQATTPYKKDDAQQLKFKKDLLLFVTKAYMPISIVESQWLWHLVLCQDPWVVFLNWK
jgi:hypothetical protein